MSLLIWNIQATLAPPVTGKMFKGLLMCYTVLAATFFTVAIAGYWAFGIEAQGNIVANLEPYVPKWLNFLTNILVLAQLVAVGLVSSSTLTSLQHFSVNDLFPES